MSADPEKVAEAVGAAMMRSDRAAAHNGISALCVRPGGADVELTLAAHHLNGHGNCHGGVLFLLADTALGLACNSYGPMAVAAGADIVFARPAVLGERLVATAVERDRFGRSALFDVTIRRGDEVIAEFRGRTRTIGQSQPGSDGVMVT
ncbi:MAG TPA: hydroxyphenylacetyl-CoA thioesterase PaaI [Sporichthyaceae bacterium]|nr:hydroxyphenylacetyl-CoA thioesterase PaaI [Sporichthyaceae bacterium]